MAGRDILGNDALVAPAALARVIVPLFVFYSGRDRRFFQENAGSVYLVFNEPPTKCSFKR
jgi:hypothetical protein